MHSNDKIFRPLMSSQLGVGEAIALDQDTPRGMFLADSGNRYLVCDGPEHRFAIALSHADIREFTVIRLSEQVVENGKALGSGEVRLSSVLWNDTDGAYPGTLAAGDGFIAMLVRDDDEGLCWIIVAHGLGGQPDTEYGRWSLVSGQDHFFTFDTKQRLPEPVS